MKILVTGAAGFIGYYLSVDLLSKGHEVVGLDNLNDYYEVSLKEERLRLLKKQFPNIEFFKEDLADKPKLMKIFEKYQFDIVVNLAAQAGVRYSITNPDAYLHSNLTGFLNILECCRNYPVKHLVYASSSSVYGMNKKIPFSVHDNVDHPVSLYAATKKSNELLAHSYSSLYGIPTTGLRFFTVYGPMGRPDMAYFKFAKAIMKGEKIDVYNDGDMMRDFTFVDDIVQGISGLLNVIPEKNEKWDAEKADPGSSSAPYRVFNIGNNNPVKLMDFIKTLERHLGKEAEKNYMPMQPGDVYMTYADIDDLTKACGYKPVTNIDKGLKIFVDWFKEYYGY